MESRRNEEHIEEDSITDSVTSLKRRIKALEKRMQENEELRLKFGDQPEKFVESEVSLDEEIRKFESLAAQPSLYPAFQSLGGSRLIVSLLGHPNSDIAMTSAYVLSELTEVEEADKDSLEEVVKLVEHLLEDFDFFSLLADNLNRIDETASDEDFQGVKTILQCVDHCREVLPKEVTKELIASKRLLQWLLVRVVKPQLGIVDYNTLYVAELLDTILQSNEIAVRILGSAPPEGFNAVDQLLVALSAYKKFKKEWSSPAEREFVMNLKNALIALLLVKENRDIFVTSQGVQLMVRILQEKSRVYPHALQILDLAILENPEAAHVFVRSKGLGPLFALLKKRGTEKSVKTRNKDLESILSIICHLTTSLTGQEQSRLMSKFFETDAEKLKLLLKLHKCYLIRDLEAQKYFEEEDGWKRARDYQDIDALSTAIEFSELEESTYSDRQMDGLQSLQCIDRIFLRLCDYGNDLLSTQIHVLLDVPLESAKDENGGSVEEGEGRHFRDGFSYSNSVTEIICEYIDHLPNDHEEKEKLLQSLKRCLSEHSKYLERGESLLEAAAEAREKREIARQTSERETADAERRARNKRRKVAYKMAKFDRELQRREELEEYRWNRKHGIEM